MYNSSMSIEELSQIAINIRNKYEKFETEMYGKPWTTEQIMEGFVGDVGDLMKLVMVKEGYRKLDNANINEELSHELSDCLLCILVLASKYNIDLEKEFLKTMSSIEKKIQSNE